MQNTFHRHRQRANSQIFDQGHTKTCDTQWVQNRLVWLGMILLLAYSLWIFLPKPMGQLDLSTMHLCHLYISPDLMSDGWTQVVALMLSRMSAFMMYPSLLAVYISKAHVFNTWYSSSIFSLYLPLECLHVSHVQQGWVLGMCTIVHATTHIYRWASRGELFERFLSSKACQTGLFLVVILLIIVVPMSLKKCKQHMTFERRKMLHYLSIPW